jgi:Zn-dependent protease with chaperone function
MNVLPLLSRNPQERYFTTNARVAALSFGNKIVFGRRYYSILAQNERLATCAHEFAHVLDKDNKKWRFVALSLAISWLLAIVTFVGSHAALMTETAFAFGFLGSISAFSWADAERNRQKELKCDQLAAYFVGGEDLITSIRVAESFLKSKSKQVLPTLKGPQTYPTLTERAEAIRKVQLNAQCKSRDIPP